jgi:hypothetical protein
MPLAILAFARLESPASWSRTAGRNNTGATGATASAYPRCLTYAAFDRAIRTLLVEHLAAARQMDRASALARLDPLAAWQAVEFAMRILDPMGAPPPMQGCDPVQSAAECLVRHAARLRR